MNPMATTKYLAIDVHQATSGFTVRAVAGVVLERGVVETSAHALVALLRRPGPNLHVTFDEGTQAQWLHDLLVPHAARVVVCDPRANRQKLANKSNRIDADPLRAPRPRLTPHCLPRRDADPPPQGARPRVRGPRLRLHPRNASHQGHLPRPRHRHARPPPPGRLDYAARSERIHSHRRTASRPSPSQRQRLRTRRTRFVGSTGPYEMETAV